MCNPDNKMCNSDCFREAIKNKTVLFGSIDPTVGGWGRVDPNFYKSLFLWHFDTFLTKIIGKFTVKITFRDPNLSFFMGCVARFTSLGKLTKIKPFFL